MPIGYAFMLALEDGTPAEPVSVARMIPNWEPGEEIIAAGNRRFRILAVDNEPIGDECLGLLVVDPVD